MNMSIGQAKLDGYFVFKIEEPFGGWWLYPNSYGQNW